MANMGSSGRARKTAGYRPAPASRGFLAVWASAYAGAAVWLTLAISAWGKGLFFNYAALLTAGLVLIGLGFLTGWVDRRHWYALIPWAAAALGYTLALTRAVDIGTAEQGVFLHWTLVAMAGAALVMAKDIVYTRRFVAMTGYLIALLAFAIPLTTAHWLTIPGVIFPPNRWATVFQYPDTAGAVFGAGYLALGLLRVESRWELWVKRGAAMINGAGLLLSLSRGADLVMPFALIAGLIVVLRRGLWTTIAAEFIGAGVGGVLLTFVWRDALTTSHFGPLLFLAMVAAAVAVWQGGDWLWRKLALNLQQTMALAVLGALALAAALGVYVHHKSKEPVIASTAKPYAISTTHPLIGGRLHVTTSGPATLTLVANSRFDQPTTLVQKSVQSSLSVRIPPLGRGNQALAVTVTPTKAPVAVEKLTMTARRGGAVNLLPWFVHVMPQSIYSRIIEVSGRQLAVWQRGVFVANGMTMAAANPLVGYGAGGWAGAYRSFQSLPYTSREVHDGWVQWWIDGGALAGLGYAALLAGAGYAIWRARKLPATERWVAASLAALTMALLGHSLVDWDLSFFWDELLVAAAWSALVGVATRPVQPTPVAPKPVWPVWTAAGISCGLALFTLNLAQAQGYVEAASKQVTRHQPYRSILKTVQVALRDQPNLGSAQQLKAELLAALSTQPKSGIDFPMANQAYQRAVALMPTSAAVHAAYGGYLVQAKQYPAALSQFMQAIRTAPMRTASLNIAWGGLYNVAVAGLSQGSRSVAQLSARDLHRAFASYAKAQASIPTGMIASLQLPAPTGAGQLAQGLNALMQGHRKAAAALFANVTPSSLTTTGHEWIEIIALTGKPTLWPKTGILGTVAQNLVKWGMVK